MDDSVWMVVGATLTAFAIWLMLRIINSPKQVIADLLSFRMLFFWAGLIGATFGFAFDSNTAREIAGPNLRGTLAGAGVGLLFGWLISRRDVSPPTDDHGRR